MEHSEAIDPAMKLLRERIPGNTLEHRAIMECLTKWANPQWKLTRLVKQGALLRIRPGLYVFGPSFRRTPISMPSLANKVLGPSYVSLDWALAYYGMIPEAVVAVTSVTYKRSREYKTPVGRFLYEHIHPDAYAAGITWVEQRRGSPALIATREKALADQLVIRKGKVTSLKQMEALLFDDLRIDIEEAESLDHALLHAIHDARPHSAIRFLIRFLEQSSS